MPQFYFALGRAPAARDWAVCTLVGQRRFLVPAGSPAERHLRTMPDVSVILDSGAYPPGNTARPSLRQYGWIVRWWSGQLDRFAWAVSYDTLGDPARTAHDHERLLDLPWRWPADIPIVPVRAYPHHSAGDILAEALGVRDDLDDEENAQYDRLLTAGELAAHGGRPACAVGGLAVARYTKRVRPGTAVSSPTWSAPPARRSMSRSAASTCSASAGPTGSAIRSSSPSTPQPPRAWPAWVAGAPCGATTTWPSASRWPNYAGAARRA
jgi:hypothetical protein